MFMYIAKRFLASSSGRAVEWLLLFVAVGYAAWIRFAYIFRQALPTGDEVNAYIFSAQQVIAGGEMPSLAEFPGAVLVYAGLIQCLSWFDVPLASVHASRWCAVLASGGSVVLLWLSLRALFTFRIATVGAVIWLIFPGTAFILRADLSLYALWLTALHYALIRLVRDPRWVWSIVVGVITGVFYMTRSDGLYVSVLTLAAFGLYRQCRLKSVASLLVMGLTVAGYLGMRTAIVGEVGPMPTDRALAAFYQAEGLHDRQGGTWHEYVGRGQDRYSKYVDEGDGLLTLLVRARGDVLERVQQNATLVRAYMHETLSVPLWAAGLLMACGLAGAASRRAVCTLVLPGLAVCALYLLFYYQRSYFVLLSYCFCFAWVIGLAALVRMMESRSRRPVFEAPVCLLAIVAAVISMQAYYAPVAEVNSSDRLRGALAFIETENLLDPETQFYSRMYSGSRAMNVYVNIPYCGVPEEAMKSHNAEELLQVLSRYEVSMVLAMREDPALWNLWPDHADLLYRNDADDVRVYGLRTAHGLSLTTQASELITACVRANTSSGVPSADMQYRSPCAR